LLAGPCVDHALMPCEMDSFPDVEIVGGFARMPVMVDPARYLKAARVLLGMTQHDLAKASGISRATIDRIERGANARRHSFDRLQETLERRGITFQGSSEKDDGAIILRKPGVPHPWKRLG